MSYLYSYYSVTDYSDQPFDIAPDDLCNCRTFDPEPTWLTEDLPMPAYRYDAKREAALDAAPLEIRELTEPVNPHRDPMHFACCDCTDTGLGSLCEYLHEDRANYKTNEEFAFDHLISGCTPCLKAHNCEDYPLGHITPSIPADPIDDCEICWLVTK